VSVARTLRATVAACGVAGLLAAVGCSTDEEAPAADGAGKPTADRAPAKPKAAPEHSRRPATCPPDAGNCRTASGRILYVERVDPDGDGDAHFVLVSREGITAPGLSVIDVKRSLRPSPLPGPGDWISAAGPVYNGSHGQKQIEAIRVRVARRG
jgi:hypothetical protein